MLLASVRGSWYDAENEHSAGRGRKCGCEKAQRPRLHQVQSGYYTIGEKAGQAWETGKALMTGTRD